MSVTSQPTMTELDACWLAAVLDCEGWIGMSHSRRVNGDAWWPRIGVGNTRKELVTKCQAITRLGRIYLSPRQNGKDVWMWLVTTRDGVDAILRWTRPYLLLKGEQADCILRLPPKHVKNGPKRAEIGAQLTILNRKGIV